MISIEKKKALSVMLKMIDNYFNSGDGSQQVFLSDIIHEKFNKNRIASSGLDRFLFASEFINLNIYKARLNIEEQEKLFPDYKSVFNNLYQKIESIIVSITKKFLHTNINDIFSKKQNYIENDLRSISAILKGYYIYDKYKIRYIYWKLKELISLGFTKQEKIKKAIYLFILQNPSVYPFNTERDDSFYFLINKKVKVWEVNCQNFKFDIFLAFSIINHDLHFPNKEIA